MDLSHLRIDHQDNLTHVSFKDTAFLQMFGLHEHNVLDYFSLSQFYDKSCIHEQLKMQARYNELQAAQLDRRQMTGLDYELWYFTHQPSLYVIRKYQRHSPTKVDLLAVYYIVDGTIYQAPDAHSILRNRLKTSMFFLQDAFTRLEASGYRFDPMQGYAWEADYQAYLKATTTSTTTKTTHASQQNHIPASRQASMDDSQEMSIEEGALDMEPKEEKEDKKDQETLIPFSFELSQEEALEALKQADDILATF